jgi:hypothetical protein
LLLYVFSHLAPRKLNVYSVTKYKRTHSFKLEEKKEHKQLQQDSLECERNITIDAVDKLINSLPPDLK